MKMLLQKHKAKSELKKAFKSAGMITTYKNGDKEITIYPKIHEVHIDKDEKLLRYTFTLLNGMDPKEVKKKEFVFKQHFGKNIEVDGDLKKFVLTVFHYSMPTEVTYNAADIKKEMEEYKLGVICGIDRNGQYVSFDLLKHPHILIAGETGSGKSTQLRSILVSMILNIPPERLQLYLCDLKRSEFHLFRQIKHVQGQGGVLVSPKEMLPVFKGLIKEIRRRGDLLDEAGLSHVDDLPDPPPYIVLCIDEVALLQKEKALMDIVEEISSIGRALGVFLILSMQRPDKDVLDGKLKNNLTIRMGFKCADLINSRIIGTPGSEKLKNEGRMLLKLQGADNLKEVQAPYLTLDKAKELLKPYSIPKDKIKEVIESVPKPKQELIKEEIEDSKQNDLNDLFK